MKQTLLDQLFYNQDKWQECEKKISMYRGAMLWDTFVLGVCLVIIFIANKTTLIFFDCCFVAAFTTKLVWKRKVNKLRKEREKYARNYYEYMDLLIKSKIVEVHDEQES